LDRSTPGSRPGSVCGLSLRMPKQPSQKSPPADAALARALALVRDLRARCPWDHAQTRDTLRPYLVEEALELDQALRHGEPAELRDELGDLLLHLAFQIVIGEERRELDAETVTRALEEKMWRRHPKLFGNAQTPDHESWERTKRREREAVSGTLRGLPPTLPPLLMAYRLQERAAGVGFDWPDARGPIEKVKEEIGELEVEMRDAGSGKRDSLQDEIGDLLFAVVNLARKLAIDPRSALEGANEKFTRRFAAVERLAEQRGIELGRAALDELDKLWDEVKTQSL
jgi:ATP diphosphatase